MSPVIKACMGGRCQRRERCAHYVEPTTRENPAERLCDPGVEQAMFFIPLNHNHIEAVPA